MPFYAATLARAHLTKAQRRLAARLKDPLGRADAWPPARTLLLLKLLAAAFPPSDKRHPVLTPAGLLACACLAHCPRARPSQVASGLFLSSLALHLHSQARRFVPEPLGFAVAMLATVLPPEQQRQLEQAAAGGSGGSARGAGPGTEEPSWLRISAADLAGSATGAATGAGLPVTQEDIVPLDMAAALGSPAAGGTRSEGSAHGRSASAGEAYWSSPAFKTSAAAAAVRVIARSAEVFADLAPLPEVLAPAQRVLGAIVAAADAAAAPPAAGRGTKPDGKKQQQQQQQQPAAFVIAPGLAQLCAATLAQLDAAAAAVVAHRHPLVNTSLLKLPEARQYNPRFEEDFATNKDYDPDR